MVLCGCGRRTLSVDTTSEDGEDAESTEGAEGEDTSSGAERGAEDNGDVTGSEDAGGEDGSGPDEAVCGNGIVEKGELCDSGPTGTCTLCVVSDTGSMGYRTCRPDS